MQQLGGERVVQLSAQASDRDVDDIGVAVEIHIPYLLRDRRAGENSSLAPQQQGQEHELLGGEIQTLTGPKRLALDEVHLQVGEPVYRRFVCPSAPEQRLHARE